MTAAEKYVAGADLGVFTVVLIYLVIMALKLARLQREMAELATLARRRRDQILPEGRREAAEVG